MSTFREAVTPTPTDTVAPVTPKDPTEKQGASLETATKKTDHSLLATYQDETGKPFTADYYEISDIWDKEPTMARDLSEIEGYIKDQVTKGELDNSTKAAATYIKELERKAGLNRYESTNKRITKLLAYIDFQRIVNG